MWPLTHLAKMKLLIVDDHTGVRALIRQLAALPDTAVRECGSGEQALEIVRAFAPDVVTMDVRLPGLSGLEVTRALRVASPAPSVVVVSAYNLPSVREAAHAAGATAFVAKDNLTELLPVFARLADDHRSSRACPPPDASFRERS